MKSTDKLTSIIAYAGILMAGCSGKLLIDRPIGENDREAGSGRDAAAIDDGRGRLGNGGSIEAGAGGGSGVVSGGGRGQSGNGGVFTGGGGNSSGGYVGGDGGAATFKCPLEATGGPGGIPASVRWTGNGPDCPSGVPAERSPCTVSPGEICVYYDGARKEKLGWFTCVPSDRTNMVWYLYNSAYNEAACPTAQPEQGTPCPEDAGPTLECFYPDVVRCSCAGGTFHPSWACSAIGTRATSFDPILPPDKPDGAKRIRDLSDDERQQWCEWFACRGRAGQVPPSPTPLSADGYTTGHNCAASNDLVISGVVASSLPIAYCVANLALSKCEAEVSDLNDCALNFSAPVLTGCGRYFATPGCSGTIAISDADYHGSRGGASSSGPGLAMECPLRVR